MNFALAGAGVCSALLVVAALHDLAARTVPNSLIGIIGLGGIGLAVAQHRLLPSIFIAVLLLAIAAVLWLRGYLGGADAKLLGAVSLFVPPVSVALMLGATAIAGGLLCLPYLPGARGFARPPPGRPAQLLARLWRCERWRLRRRGPLPYAVAIAAGTLFVMWQGA